MLLVRILIAKVKDRSALEAILRTIPIRAGQPEHPGWNCVGWVKEALETIQAHEKKDKALGTAILDWQTVRDAAMEYIDKKRAQGRWTEEARNTFNMSAVPTFDLLESTETVV